MPYICSIEGGIWSNDDWSRCKPGNNKNELTRQRTVVCKNPDNYETIKSNKCEESTRPEMEEELQQCFSTDGKLSFPL